MGHKFDLTRNPGAGKVQPRESWFAYARARCPVGMGLIFLVLFYSSSQARLGWMGVYEVAVLDPCLVGKETPDMTSQGREQKI